MLKFPLLSIIIFLPILGSFLALATGRNPRLCRWTCLVVTLAEVGLVGFIIFLNLKPQYGPSGIWLLREDYPWIEWLGATYSLTLDGISLMLVAAYRLHQCPLRAHLLEGHQCQGGLLPFLSALSGRVPPGPLYGQ